MTKIAMVTGQALPHIGGVEIHIDRICKELVKDRSLDITVICAASGGSDYPYKVIRDYSMRNREYLNQFDIVHFHDFIHYLHVDVPSYITFHGWEGHCPPDPSIAIQRRNICHNVRGVIHVGDYLRKWYGTNHYNDRTIMGGCYPKPYSDHSEYRSIGYVGQLRQDKGVNIYEEAAKLVPSLKLEVASNIPPDMIDKFWEDKAFGFCNGYLASLEAMMNSVPCIAYYANEMVEDGLSEMPLYLARNTAEIAKGLEIATSEYKELSRLSHEYAMRNTWEIAANTYKSLWGLL